VEVNGEQRTSQFEDLGRQILKHCSRINGGAGTNTKVTLCALLEVTVDTANGELPVHSHVR
jgi:hypothetical protein